jgi:hypothetical protein
MGGNLQDTPTSEFTWIAPTSGTTAPNGLRRSSPTWLRVVQHCLNLLGGQALGPLSVGEGRLAGTVDEEVDLDALVDLDAWENGTASVVESVARVQRIVIGRIFVDCRFYSCVEVVVGALAISMLLQPVLLGRGREIYNCSEAGFEGREDESETSNGLVGEGVEGPRHCR